MNQMIMKRNCSCTEQGKMPKPRHDSGMEGAVARWYARNTGQFMGEFEKLAQRVAGSLPPQASVLEVAPGPGYFCIELARRGPFSITGLDLSHTFVELGRENAANAGVNVDFKQGNASSLPFADDTFDFLLCRAAFKNFAQPIQAMNEMCRVLKPGGRAMIIDLSRNASPQDIDQHVDTMGVNRINRILIKLTFRFMLLRRAYTREQFEHIAAQTAFRNVEIKTENIGLELLLTK